MNFDGNAVETSMTMMLDSSGNLLVETTRPDFQGGGCAGYDEDNLQKELSGGQRTRVADQLPFVAFAFTAPSIASPATRPVYSVPPAVNVI